MAVAELLLHIKLNLNLLNSLLYRLALYIIVNFLLTCSLLHHGVVRFVATLLLSKLHEQLAHFEVETPIAVPTRVQNNKPECYGVFCLTYDLKACIIANLQHLMFRSRYSNGVVVAFYFLLP
ncbi:Malate dehydrogenase [NADP] chloroplastic [Bienertia sinuspersici]